jgi:hypothetical protein
MAVTKVVLADRAYDVGGTGYAPKSGFSIGAIRAGDAILQRLTRAALWPHRSAARGSHCGGRGMPPRRHPRQDDHR